MKKRLVSVTVSALIAFAVVSGVVHAVDNQPNCELPPGFSRDGPAATRFWTEHLATQVSDNIAGLHALDNFIRDWNSPTCQFDDGRPLISVLVPAFSRAFNMEKDWSKSLQVVELIKTRYPNSEFAALAEASYWSAYAWNARGGGYASSVTPEGWKLLKERMEKAESVLIDSKPVATSVPGWYELMIQVQSALDRPAQDRDKTFIEGATRHKTYVPIYLQMQNYLEPKWGGSWETIDNLVTWSVNNTKATEGQAMYARIYWSVAQGVTRDDNLFKITLAKWPKMKAGFEDLMKRHPKSKWNLNNFAAFACQAGDKITFSSLRKQIKDDVIDAAWSKNHPLDLCEQKFGSAK